MDALAHTRHRRAIGLRFAQRIRNANAVFIDGLDKVGGAPCLVVDDGAARPFGGVNSLILLQVMKDRGWSDPRFLTVQSVAAAGGAMPPDAMLIRMQYLVATGVDGSALDKPMFKSFHVVHASQVGGLMLPEAVGASGLVVDDFLKAARIANPENGVNSDTSLAARVPMVLKSWLSAIVRDAQAGQPCIGHPLTLALASSLVQAQLGGGFGNSGFEDSAGLIATAIEDDPLFFTRAAKAARWLEATVIKDVRSLAVKVDASEQIVQQHAAGDEEVESPSPMVASAKSGVRATKRPLSGRSLERFAAKSKMVFDERAAVLQVQFIEKEAVKKLGAIWYKPESVWFVPKGLDVGAFRAWTPSQAILSRTVSESETKAQFAHAMAEVGLVVPDEIHADGKWRSVPVNTKAGQKNKAGSYILTLDGGHHEQAIGTVINRHTGASQTWTGRVNSLTPEQRTRQRTEAAAHVKAQLELTMKVQDTAAEHACAIWELGVPASDHAYVLKKGICADGLRQVNGAVLRSYPDFHGESGRSIIRKNEDYLLVPMCTASGVLRAVQAINSTGEVKTFMRGAQKSGLMMVMGAQSFNHLLVAAAGLAFAEGVATAASFRESSGLPTVVCFDAGNLVAVASEVASSVPADVQCVVAADNDQYFVHRALGCLAEKVGLNPHAPSESRVQVASGPKALTALHTGEAHFDGQWHDAVNGSYCVSTKMSAADQDVVESVKVEVVPLTRLGGSADEVGINIRNKQTCIFLNRGVEAGIEAMDILRARANGARVTLAVPVFKSNDQRPTDWNDLAKLEGLEACRAVLVSQGVAVGKSFAAKEVPVFAPATLVARHGRTRQQAPGQSR